ncbi:MAG: hypothetical protein IMY79_03450 [Chloroflexi bacterium]|nr:hypothetical protein [Chloroflexota bacterium]
MNTRKLFGTSIRDVVPQDLSPDSCCQVAIAVGATPSQSSTICVATPTRTSDELVSKGTELVRSLVEADG